MLASAPTSSSQAWITACSPKLRNGTGAPALYWTSNISHGRAGRTTDKAALAILRDRELQGNADGLAFVTQVLLQLSRHISPSHTGLRDLLLHVWDDALV